MNRRFLLPIMAVLVLVVAWMAIFGLGMLSSQSDVSMAVTGDVMFGRQVHNALSLGSSPFDGVSNVTSNVDLLLINFENAATISEVANKTDLPLKCSPGYTVLARANNNTVAALANNHVCDYGLKGMRDTFNALDKANITHLGAGNSETEAHMGLTQQINGRQITILNYMDSNNFAGYSYDQIPYANGSNGGYSAYDADDAKSQIQSAKESGNFVMVFMHFGNEYSTSPNDDQIKIAHQLIDDGADVVLGAHPHVAQGIEMYDGKPIFYSLGDFIFDLEREGTLDNYFVQIDLHDDKGICTVYPIHLTGYLPQYMSKENGTAFLNGLNPKCSQLEVTDEGIGKLEFSLD